MDCFLSMDDPTLKRQLSDDTVLQCVNRHFITLQRNEVKENNQYLLEAISDITDNMKRVNSLFGKTYRTMFFGGSFYKKTKISKPTEFDLNMVVKLPFKETSIVSGPPGFIQIYLPTGFNFTNYTPAEQKTLNSFVTNDGFLSQERFRAWIEGTITKAISQLPKINGEPFITSDCFLKYKVIKSGPAFTFALKINDNVTISVDLVPVLGFDKKLPYNRIRDYRLSKCASTIWLVIPKPLSYREHGERNDIYWRLSFYDQEKQILTKCGRTKLLIRLMKKLRDTQGWFGLKSYYIETLFLHELETMENDFNTKPLTLVFFMMLHRLIRACSNHQIYFYWDEDCNLLNKMKASSIDDIKNRLCRIVKDIQKNIGYNRYVIAKYILDAYEYVDLIALLNTPLPESGSNAEEQQWTCTIS